MALFVVKNQWAGTHARLHAPNEVWALELYCKAHLKLSGGFDEYLQRREAGEPLPALRVTQCGDREAS